MGLFTRYMIALVLSLAAITSVSAQEITDKVIFRDFDLNIESIELSTSDVLLAANTKGSKSYQSKAPNIPDAAFKEPWITENNIHEYLGLASLAMGGVAAISAPEGYDPYLLDTVHYKAAKLSWQLGAAAVATGLYSHWDDFYLADGLLDRDNLHAILGFLGTLGYYLAVSSAVDEYNNQGYPTEEHASKGILGGASMLLAIGFTW